MIEENPNTGNRSLDMCRRVVTTESFIEEAKAVYGNAYDYSKVDYKNRDTQVTIICPVHGDFKVYAREHLDGKRCPKCEKSEKFLGKLHEKFGDRFSLDNYIYSSSTIPVELICPEHGPFRNLPNTILRSVFGCPKCAEQANERAHAEAETRKAAARQLKEEERQRAREEKRHLISEADEDIRQRLKAWRVLPEDRKKMKSASALLIFRKLVQSYISTTLNSSLWIEPLRLEHLMPEDEVAYFFDCDEGDEVYKFEGEAPDPMIIALYETWENTTLEQSLSGHNVIVRFIGEDLYIIHRRYVYSEQAQTNRAIDRQMESLPESFVAIDFEHLYPQKVTACSVGLAKYENGQLVDKYYSLIRPPFEYEGKRGKILTYIHHIKEADLVDERPMPEVLPEMESFIGDLPLVAHNSTTEEYCIKRTTEFYDLATRIDFEHIIDTIDVAKFVEDKLGISIEGSGQHRLDVVCSRFSVPVQNHHNALDDAIMCGDLLLKLKQKNDDLKEQSSSCSQKKDSVSDEKKVLVVSSTIIDHDKLDSLQNSPFCDATVVLSGFAESIKKEYKAVLERLGAKVTSSVSNKTTYLICGPTVGPSKKEKAENLGVTILPEADFLSIINPQK